jgi:hypothetical protein
MGLNRIKNENRAWLRIIEAFLAVLIVMSAVVIILVNKESKSYLDERVYEKQEYILDLIEKNETMRIEIIDTGINDPEGQTNNYFNGSIRALLPGSLEYNTRICGLGDICIPSHVPTSGKDVFYSEKIITSSINNYAPKKVVLATWLK